MKRLREVRSNNNLIDNRNIEYIFVYFFFLYVLYVFYFFLVWIFDDKNNYWRDRYYWLGFEILIKI